MSWEWAGLIDTKITKNIVRNVADNPKLDAIFKYLTQKMNRGSTVFEISIDKHVFSPCLNFRHIPQSTIYFILLKTLEQNLLVSEKKDS